MMSSLVLHIGLHKTGTTSIQFACNKNRHILYANSINYPGSIELTLDTRMHLGLTSNISNIADLLKSQSNTGFDFVFMSNEELIPSLATMAQPDFIRLLDIIHNHYDRVVWVITTRNDADLLRSAVREYLEGSSFPIDGVTPFLTSYTHSINIISNRIKNEERIVVCIDDDRKGLSWPSYFIYKVLGKELPLPEEHQNASKYKSMSTLFRPIFRAFYSNYLARPYYSIEVTNAVEHASEAIMINQEFASDFLLTLNEYIDKKVFEFIKDPSYTDFKAMFSC